MREELRKTTTRIRGTTKEVQAAARNLREAETAAERLLWGAIRGRRLDGLKFRRQHAVGRFVLDSYCPDHRLVIELDGAIHDEQQVQDAWRTSMLETFGYRVIRFANEEVFHDLSGVLDQIRAAISEQSDRQAR